MTMLQKIDFEDDVQELQADRGHLLQPAFYWDLFKRRWAFFLLPLILIAPLGIAVAYLLPPTFLSEGKILVQSQQIPSELVRSTVTNAAQERIQVIQQRTMTRDNLIAIADKFQLYPEKRTLMSVSELVELMRKNTRFAPIDLPLDFKQRSRAAVENPTILFSVGFEYSDAATASRVANELMTRILNEDLRDRTSRATDTTKFLAREVQRLQAESSVVDSKIAQLKLSQGKAGSSTRNDQPSMLDQLRTELVQKNALYSDRHPQIQSLKRQIEAMEKAAPAASTGPNPVAASSLDALISQQDGLQKSLEAASTKLAAARLGESLEKEQQSEKLEIIEQPSTPQEPIKPNRPKFAALAVLIGLMAGAGVSFLAEISNAAIRRSSDLFTVIDSKLIVAIPYIITTQEVRRKKTRFFLLVLCVVILLTVVLTGAYFYLPPVDLMISRARVGLFR